MHCNRRRPPGWLWGALYAFWGILLWSVLVCLCGLMLFSSGSMLCVLMECLCQCSLSWKEPRFHAPAPHLNMNHSVGRGDEWEIGIKSMFLIQTKMLDRQKHIKWEWKEPLKPTPSPCWSFPIMLNYLHLKTCQRHCPALQNGALWRTHMGSCASPCYLSVSPCPGLSPDLTENLLPDDQLTE